MADLIVKAAVKEELNDKNVASDFYQALDEEVSNSSKTPPTARNPTVERPSSRATCNSVQSFSIFFAPRSARAVDSTGARPIATVP